MAALQDCVLLLTLLGRQDLRGRDEPAPPEDAAVGSVGDPHLLSAWSEHSAAVSAALEGVWRVQGRLGLCGGDMGDAKGWDLRGTSHLPCILGDGGGLLLATQQAGPGSIEHRQLFSMLCSALKLFRILSTRGILAADKGVWTVVQCASEMLREPGSDQQPPAAGDAAAAAAAAAAAEGDTLASSAAAAAAASQQQSGAEGRLPWLVLLGRCFVYHGEQLLHLQQHTPNIGEHLQALAGHAMSPTGTVFPGVHAWHPAAFLDDGPTWFTLFDGCKQGLTQGVGVGSLGAAGYPIHSAVQHVNTAIAALHALEAAGDAAASAAAYTAFAQHLQALGGVLSTLPVPLACNNPYLHTHAGSNRAGVSVRAQLHLRGLRCGPLLWACVPAGKLEAA